MKSLCSSSPFWKTLSGISTRGLPDSAMDTGAKRRRVLFSDFRIFSTRVGAGGLAAKVGFLGGISVEVGGGHGFAGEGFWSIGFWLTDGGGRVKGTGTEPLEALLV